MARHTNKKSKSEVAPEKTGGTLLLLHVSIYRIVYGKAQERLYLSYF